MLLHHNLLQISGVISKITGLKKDNTRTSLHPKVTKKKTILKSHISMPGR